MSDPVEQTRGLLDDLLIESRMYTSSKGFEELLEFVVKLRCFAPFNAMLLHVQKPGISYAASRRDWRTRFEREVNHGARPLLILWPFAPVALVYDVQDTEGKELPEDVEVFSARGPITRGNIEQFRWNMERNEIIVEEVDFGANAAGSIRVTRPAGTANGKAIPRRYGMQLNRNAKPPASFATMVHELAHLYLGHLGSDAKLKVLNREAVSEERSELEAESAAFIVCKRNGVDPDSHKYLSHFVTADTTLDDLEVHRILQAAGQIESLLGLAERTTWDRPKKPEKAPSLFDEGE